MVFNRCIGALSSDSKREAAQLSVGKLVELLENHQVRVQMVRTSQGEAPWEPQAESKPDEHSGKRGPRPDPTWLTPTPRHRGWTVVAGGALLAFERDTYPAL